MIEVLTMNKLSDKFGPCFELMKYLCIGLWGFLNKLFIICNNLTNNLGKEIIVCTLFLNWLLYWSFSIDCVCHISPYEGVSSEYADKMLDAQSDSDGIYSRKVYLYCSAARLGCS